MWVFGVSGTFWGYLLNRVTQLSKWGRAEGPPLVRVGLVSSSSTGSETPQFSTQSDNNAFEEQRKWLARQRDLDRSPVYFIILVLYLPINIWYLSLGISRNSKVFRVWMLF